MIDDTLIGQKLKVDRPAPKGLANHDDGDRLDFSGLYQCQNLEQFVESTITTRERD